jgi:hypothetical protein
VSLLLDTILGLEYVVLYLQAPVHHGMFRMDDSGLGDNFTFSYIRESHYFVVCKKDS